MATVVQQYYEPPLSRVLQQQRIDGLMNLQKAAQTINSILDLDVLLDVIINRITVDFGCVEAGIYLADREREEFVVSAVRGCTVNHKGSRFPLAAGISGQVFATGKAWYAPDVRLEPNYQPCEAATRSELMIPLVVRGNAIGVFDTSHHELDAFPPSQIELLKALSGHIAVAIDNARRFQEEKQEKERFAAEQQEARRIQETLFPKNAPQVPGFEIEGQCLPAGAVGGDWYDYIALPDGRVAAVLADVSGKGMAAALLMSATRGIVRSLAQVSDSPGEILRRVNRMLLEDFPSERYVTMVLAVVDATRREVTIANAGHPWPLLWDGKSARCVCTETGFPLGLLPCEFGERTIAMPAGSRLLLFTDGITEAQNPAGEEYGVERLEEHLGRSAVTTASLLAEVRSFMNGRGAGDDTTLVLFKSE